jgi:hypothetical protein
MPGLVPGNHLSTVMPGFMPGIHVLRPCNNKDVDGRNKSGHDELKRTASLPSCPALFRASTPSLTIFKTPKTWMAGPSPAMTLR